MRGVGTVFMLHRFADAERGNAGFDPARLRSHLAALRAARRPLVSLDDLVSRANDGALGSDSPIAFTVDDGYADFATVAAPIFAEFDCPVTVFLVSGVIDRRDWFWWDRITAALDGTTKSTATLVIAGERRSFGWTNAVERSHVGTNLMEALKLVGNDERLRVLAVLVDQLGVDLPPQPPPRFAAMTWDDVRRCAGQGATFGGHTVTHPVLSRVSDTEADAEITRSLGRVREETSAVTDVFCYPNGRPQDFTEREVSLLKARRCRGAVTTSQGYVTTAALARDGDATRYRLPRFALPEEWHETVQILTGIERAKLRVRRVFAP